MPPHKRALISLCSLIDCDFSSNMWFAVNVGALNLITLSTVFKHLNFATSWRCEQFEARIFRLPSSINFFYSLFCSNADDNDEDRARRYSDPQPCTRE
jgi:hypothetical protein